MSKDQKWYDLSHERLIKPVKLKLHKGHVVVRDPKDVTHIMIHQTAVGFSPPRWARDALAPDRQLALARRALGVACHSMAFRGSFVVRSARPLWYVNHGNSANKYSVGLEIDANHPGHSLTKVWSGEPTEMNQEILDTALAAAVDLIDWASSYGCKITHVITHRQTSLNRRADPGQFIYGGVVRPLVERYGLVLDTGVYGGYPIPYAWDPTQSARY